MFLCGVGEHVFGQAHAAVTRRDDAFRDALDLSGVRLEISPQRLVDDVVARTVRRLGKSIDLADDFPGGADVDWFRRAVRTQGVISCVRL